MAQHSLQIGVLVSWTKSFNCSNVVGRDVVKLLNDALDKRGDTKVRVDAVLNDTTGTLLIGALLDKKTSIGLILGTGSNACYFEKIQNVSHWETEKHDEQEVILDIEWGAFGDNGVLDFIKTEFDKEVDKNSLLVNSFTFEKYIAGKYMGEIVRVVLVHLVNKGLLFNGNLTSELDDSGQFTTTFVSEIEEDRVNGVTTRTEQILQKFNLEFTQEDVTIVQYVCNIITNRAALLVSICLSVLLDRMAKEEVTIAVDGTLCSKHPTFRKIMESYIKIFTPRKFEFLLVSDGSGKGACVVAAIADKLERRYHTTHL